MAVGQWMQISLCFVLATVVFLVVDVVIYVKCNIHKIWHVVMRRTLGQNFAKIEKSTYKIKNGNNQKNDANRKNKENRKKAGKEGYHQKTALLRESRREPLENQDTVLLPDGNQPLSMIQDIRL